MTPTAKPKIEAVYPLNPLQQALLFNHRTDPANDDGLIQMRFRLSGPLDRAGFVRAWERVVQRHPVLRASVHWENISRPVWVVHPAVEVEVAFLAADDSDPVDRWATFLAQDRQQPIELNRAPAGRLTVLTVDAQTHYFAWTSHHMLLDGWSAEAVLRDFFFAYGKPGASWEPLPTHKDYLRWLNTRDRDAALRFWRDELGGHRNETVFPAGTGAQREDRRVIPPDLARRVTESARERSLSLNTVVQGIWAALLSRYFDAATVCFGVTASGRPADIPQFEAVAGMYANVLPKVIDLAGEDSYFKSIQQRNGASQDHQFLFPDEIAAAVQRDGLPFNSLLTVQNYPWSSLSAGNLRVAEYVGDMTSNFPLNAIFILRDEWEVVVRYNEESLRAEQAGWFLEGILSLLTAFVRLNGGESFPAVARRVLPAPPLSAAQDAAPAHRPPSNTAELELHRIWSGLLPVAHLGVDDDFFRLGGTSFLAIKMFARVEARLGKKLSPSTLLTHRTIAKMAELVTDGRGAAGWTNLVPLRTAGSLAPIFCFHAGEGHVLMYEPLVRHLDPERPVYALQPNGLDGKSELHGSVEEMAAHYLREIDRVGAPEPLILLAYCYSGVICVEIGRRLVAAGRPAPLIIGTDIDPPDTVIARRRGSPKWYWSNGRAGLWRRVYEQFATDFIPQNWMTEGLRSRLRARRLKTGLIDAFNRYPWPTYPHPLLLIRSRELRGWDKHQGVVESWERITEGRLELDSVEGDHAGLYREPGVQQVAAKVEAYIRKKLPVG